MNNVTANSQGALNIGASFKPFTKSISTPPKSDVMVNSSLNMGNKRTWQSPTNYIGIKSFHIYNAPTNAYRPTPIGGRYNFQGPVLHTSPVQRKYQ